MPFEPHIGSYYRMPVFFGPMSGPRQWPNGRTFDFTQTPKTRMVGIRMRTSAAQLQALLPPRFELRGDPIISVEIFYMTEIGWLAGRGYNMCDVKFEVTFHGDEGDVNGTLVLVRWENLADPILSGREELGHNKLYCEIPELRVLDDSYSATMSWLATPFLDVRLANLQPPTTRSPMDPDHRGMLSYKYIPRTGEWGTADIEYVTLSPPFRENVTVKSFKTGDGSFSFRKSTWEELPTLYPIVNAFAELENHGFEGGYLVESVGGSSVAQTHIVR